jgi:hypothetical protein
MCTGIRFTDGQGNMYFGRNLDWSCGYGEHVVITPTGWRPNSPFGAIDAIGQLKKRGVKDISFLCIIAAPEGLEKLNVAHPDVQIYCAALDERLNEVNYILPGLGDAGDRIFGTK